MATKAQRQAAKKNVRKAQKTWKNMSSSQRSRAQPEGRGRTRPGRKGTGEYYHVGVRPSGRFTTFRTQDLGEPGHVQRVAGKRPSGSWDTVKWLISKHDAHSHDGTLVPDSPDAKKVLGKLGSSPRHVKGDFFQAKPRPNVPERQKPTRAQQRARSQNIKKAQAARHKQ